MVTTGDSRKPLWGLARRQERWVPTRSGWLVLLVLGLSLAAVVVGSVHGFLAVNAPIAGSALVIEGWLPDYALEQALTEFKVKACTQIYVTGIPLEKGTYLSDYKTYAELGTATLLKLGGPKALIQAVPGPSARKDRTYTSAVALKTWFDTHAPAPTAITVVSLGPHSRRTRLLFEKGLHGTTQIGIIALEDRDYPPGQWWKSSAGVRNVIGETIAYLYARLFFWPNSGS